MRFLWHIDPGTPLERPHRRDAFNLAFASVLQAASPPLQHRSDLRLVRGTCGLDTFAEATVVGRVHKKRAAFIGATASVPEEPTSPESAGRDRAVIIGAPVQRCQRSESSRTQRCRPSRASAS